MTKKFYWGTGRRKTSVARVRLCEGTGQILINERELDQYFTEEKDRAFVSGPIDLCDLKTRVDVFINVKGGGFSGQAGACAQGIARALKIMYAPNEEAQAEAEESIGFGKKLRESGYLTRDSRMKERKKYGKKGARKSFQFSKR